MKKWTVLFIILLFGIFSCELPAQAKTTTHHQKHSTKKQKHTAKKKHHKAQPQAAKDLDVGYADIIIDAKTGRVLHSTNPDALRHPASLTKMMTLLLAFQDLQSGKINLNQKLWISALAAKQEPSKLGLHAGQFIRVQDAIMGLAVESANDAAIVVAENLGENKEHFAQMMNAQARSLGMLKTHYNNPSGLPDKEQVTTARDMAILAQKLIYHYPQFYPYFGNRWFSYNGITYHNHNHLMSRYDGMDGIKTGYIDASGFNLVASAVRDNTRLIGVIFGGTSVAERDNKMADLLNQAFKQLEEEKLKTTMTEE